QKRKIWPEKQFNLTPDGQFRNFILAMDDRNWARLINPPPSFNVDLVREFYANAMPIDEDEPYSFTTMVRGRALGFDRDVINEYLGNPYELQGDDGLCHYGRVLARGNWNVQAMTEKLLMPGCTFKFNQANQPLRAMREDMKVVRPLISTIVLKCF
ncbi:hypothetical protein A2U01_0051010, partial [Trifolium medium]|nr:hypothetical protein [Trifolium medium]